MAFAGQVRPKSEKITSRARALSRESSSVIRAFTRAKCIGIRIENEKKKTCFAVSSISELKHIWIREVQIFCATLPAKIHDHSKLVLKEDTRLNFVLFLRFHHGEQ